MFEYVNFRGNKYYLKVKEQNQTYRFVKDVNKANISHIPKGYKVHENYDGRVFLVEKEKELILATEVQAVKTAMFEFSNVLYFRVSACEKTISVGTGDLWGVSNKTIDRKHFDIEFSKITHYSPNLRFNLIDEDKRLFEIERYSSCGSREEWASLGISNFEKAAKACCGQLGRPIVQE